MSQIPEAFISEAYRLFNARDIDGVLALMDPDVAWPNGMEGGHVYGHEAVRGYWTRQWKLINPHVEPTHVLELPDGRLDATVHQVVRDLDGHLLSERTLHHVYTRTNGLITRMEIVDG